MTNEEILQGLFDNTLIGNAPEVKDLVNAGLEQEMQPETLQCSLASPYPGTAMYDWVREHKYLTVDSLVDETGYQKCAVSYPDISADEIFKAVETFYRRYYFSRRYIWKSIKKMASDRNEAKRLLGEGKEFLVSMYKRRQIMAREGDRAPQATA